MLLECVPGILLSHCFFVFFSFLLYNNVALLFHSLIVIYFFFFLLLWYSLYPPSAFVCDVININGCIELFPRSDFKLTTVYRKLSPIVYFVSSSLLSYVWVFFFFVLLSLLFDFWFSWNKFRPGNFVFLFQSGWKLHMHTYTSIQIFVNEYRQWNVKPSWGEKHFFGEANMPHLRYRIMTC